MAGFIQTESDDQSQGMRRQRPWQPAPEVRLLVSIRSEMDDMGDINPRHPR